MKIVKYFLVALLLISSASAVSFDVEGFGAKLNGWRKGKLASYTLGDSSYRTHKPAITNTSSGGIFTSIKIDQGRGSKNVLHLDLLFAADGRLLTAQVKGSFAGKKVDTGQVTRQAPLPEGEAALLSPTEQIASELFAALDANVLKNAEGTEEKADLLTRVFGNKNKANMSSAVRHNFNLVVAAVR